MTDPEVAASPTIWPPAASEPPQTKRDGSPANGDALNLLRWLTVGAAVFYIVYSVAWGALSIVAIRAIALRQFGVLPTVHAIHGFLRYASVIVGDFGTSAFAIWAFIALTNVSSARPGRGAMWSVLSALLVVTPYVRFVFIFPVISGLWRDSNALFAARSRWSATATSICVAWWPVLLVTVDALIWTFNRVHSLVPKSQISLAWYSQDAFIHLCLYIPIWVLVIVCVNNITNAQLCRPIAVLELGEPDGEHATV